MSRYPSGFLFFFLCLLLLAVFSLPSHGQTVQVPLNEWTNFKAEYRTLKGHSELLSNSLSESLKNISELEIQLSIADESLLISERALKEALRQQEILKIQLIESEDLSSELKRSIRKQRIKSYLIGGAVGLTVGIIAGVIIGVNLGG